MSKKYDLVIEQRQKYLIKKGWVSSTEGIWTLPNWEKEEGVCNRRLTTAYRIQLKLDSVERQKKIEETEEVANALAR